MPKFLELHLKAFLMISPSKRLSQKRRNVVCLVQTETAAWARPPPTGGVGGWLCCTTLMVDDGIWSKVGLLGCTRWLGTYDYSQRRLEEIWRLSAGLHAAVMWQTSVVWKKSCFWGMIVDGNDC